MLIVQFFKIKPKGSRKKYTERALSIKDVESS